MPPSSEKEAHSTSVNGSNPPKQAQKQIASGVSIPSKKERKHGAGKGSDGIPPVTKPTSNMLDTKVSSSPPPSHPHPPEMNPSTVGSNESAITSPLLEALSSNAFKTAAAQNTNDWARNIPPFSGSPGNLISLSESPPALPSSYDDRSTLAQRDRRIPNGHLPSASPPAYQRRPLSFQMDSHQAYEDHALSKAPFTNRRSSMYSQQSQQSQRYGQSPPLPHHPQPHFYGAPDPLFGIPSRAPGLKPGAEGYYCGLDSLGASGLCASKYADSVTICGYEGGLNVYAILKTGLEKITGLGDLRGGVYNAKILPWTVQGGTERGFPLIAVVLDCPTFQSTDVSSGDHTVQATPEAQPGSKTESVRSSPRVFPASPPSNNLNIITHYQTLVEVYSLSSKKHVGTLLSLPKVPLATPITSPLFKRPPPIGALSISADAGNIVVTSSTTGEVWIYRQVDPDGDRQVGFRCIGKIWTTIQRTPLNDPHSQSDFTDINSPFKESQTMKQQDSPALISLKGRWLAYSPPAATSQTSLRATIPNAIFSMRTPGTNTYAPPQTPPVNCAVDIPEGEQLFKRLKREATQVLLKGAKWAGDQSVQAWNSYWNKPTGKTPTGGVGTGGQFWPLSNPQDVSHGFPPTHGEALQHAAPNGEPTLVSIMDIEKVAALRYASPALSPQPLATFKAPLGCSFMSFAPNGLSLLTVSTKGDIQFVWDLMRIQHTKSSALQTPNVSSPQGPHVRQTAVFTRVTPARIVDIAWTMPHGERIAMITKNNTVHFWDMPTSAFVWPPSRRRAKAPLPKSPATSDIADTSASATAMATNAVSAAWSLAQPLIMRPRGLSGPGRQGISAASVTAQASQGGRALATGISKSFGAATETIGEFYKSSETKVHLTSSKSPSISCIKWLDGLHRDSLAVLVEDEFRTEVKIYTVMEKKSKGRSAKQHIYVGRSTVKYSLPLLADHNIAPAIMHAIDHEDDLDLSEKDEEIQWDYRRTIVAKQDPTPGTESSIPQAEIESNAPYQPFHTDHRVSLHVYSTPSAQPPSPSVSALLTPLSAPVEQSSSTNTDSRWVFGRPISTKRLDVGPPHTDEEDTRPLEDHRALPSSAIERITTKTTEPDECGEQIVITTRRRKGVIRNMQTSGDDDGFFEDDCEVLDFASQRV